MPRTRKTKPRNLRTPRSRKPPVERGPDVPHWLPAGTCWEKLPQIIRDAVSRFVAPAYHRFVLEAPSEIERAIGTTLVHLMWLELCGQLQMAQAAADPESLDALLQNPEELIARHLHLGSVKCQTAELMVKLRVINDALERGKPLALTPGPSPVNGRGEGQQVALTPGPSPVNGRGEGQQVALTPGSTSASGPAETAALSAPATLLLPPLDQAYPEP